MPYIPKKDRERLLAKEISRTPGELNFQITDLVNKFLYEANAENYAGFNAVVGTLECVKLELYRRRIAEYENAKIKQNGDVYK